MLTQSSHDNVHVSLRPACCSLGGRWVFGYSLRCFFATRAGVRCQDVLLFCLSPERDQGPTLSSDAIPNKTVTNVTQRIRCVNCLTVPVIRVGCRHSNRQNPAVHGSENPHLTFTFIRYLGMEPINNESERMLRKVVIRRKIRQKMVTVGGKIMFGTIMTCLLTWDRMGPNRLEKPSEVSWST